MSTVFQGDSDFGTNHYKLVSERAEQDPQTGTTWTQEFEGTQDGVLAVGTVLLAAGARVGYSIKGGVNVCTARWARDPNIDPGDEVPTERWQIDLDAYQIPIFQAPAVFRDAQAYAGGAALYRTEMLAGVDAGTANPYGATIRGQVYDLLCKGVDYWETSRPVIRLNRSFTTSYPTRLTVYSDERPPCYVRATLISTYSIPSAFQSQIPADPSGTVPTGTAWAWKLRQQSSGYTPATRRWEETLEWDLALWSTYLYNVT